MEEKFNFEIDRIAGAIRERKCRKVVLQFPEGLKRQAASVATAISQKADVMVIVSGEPCFGACDVHSSDADMVVHFGHLPIPNLKTPNSVLFIQARSNADPIPVLDKAIPYLEGTVGLLTTAQHIHLIDEMASYLKSKGVHVIIGKGDDRIFAQGQVLGCNASSARAVSDDVDCFLYVGTGNFHPLAIALATPKPVFAADPISVEVVDIADLRDRLLRQRHAAIERARMASRFGIILSSKPGQRREKIAFHIQEILTGVGLESVIVEFDTVSPQKLDNIGLDAWISTACPRLAIDDFTSFSMPVLTVPEAEILVNRRSWDDYVFDEIS